MSRPKIKPQQFCIFCGRPGLSKEHIWPAWTHKIIPRESKGKNVRVAAKVNFPNPKLVVTEMRDERQGSVNTLQIRVVCRTHCNNGWMSTLEKQVKPILTPLILGQPVILGEHEQKILATWIAKTTMVFEFARHRIDVSSSPVQRQHVMKNKEPPHGWNIWIGHYRGEKWKTAAIRKSAALEVVRGEPAISKTSNARNTQSVTFGIGELIVNLVATSIPFLTFEIPPDFEPFTPQIWPFKESFGWPIGNILNDADANILSNGFSRMLRKDVDHFDPPF
jgi:hypothetical protein